MRSVLITAVLVCSAAAAAAEEVRLSVSTSRGEPVGCALSGDTPDGRLRRGAGSVWLWSRIDGDVLQCSAPGHEPRDISLDGRRSTPLLVQLLAADTSTLDFAAPTPARVEWLEEVPSGGLSTLATRAFPATQQLRIPVARAARVIRIRRAGAAPFSISIDGRDAMKTRNVPAPSPGGEIAGAIPAVALPPASIDIRRGDTVVQSLSLRHRHFFTSGLPAGRYTLEARYAGGISGERTDLDVRAGESADLFPIPLQSRGGWELLAATGACRQDLRLLIRAVDVINGRSIPRDLINIPAAPPCRWRFEGLLPGTQYDAQLTDSGGGSAVAFARIVATAGVVMRGVLDEPSVTVRGTVTFGTTRPAGDADVIFSDGSRRLTARTDGRGRYSLVLPSPGDWNVGVRSSGDPAIHWTRRSITAAGENADIVLPGGAIRVRLFSADGSTLPDAVEVELSSGSRKRRALATAAQSHSATISPLENGTWRVTASSPDGSWRTSEPLEVEVGEDEFSIDLTVERISSQLRVLRPDGMPAAGARASAGMMPLPQSNPGVFAVNGVPERTPLRIETAGYAPVCVEFTGEDATVRLVPAPHSVSLQMRERDTSRAQLSGLPGSDCSLPLAMFRTEVTRNERGMVLVIEGLPEGIFRIAFTPDDVVTFRAP